MTERAPSYATQLGETLRRRDPERLRQFLVESARRFGDDRQVTDVESKSPGEMEELLHRMILALPDLRDHHRESQAWLEDRGIAPDAGG